MAPWGRLPAGHETMRECVGTWAWGRVWGWLCHLLLVGAAHCPFLVCGVGAARLTSWAVARTCRDDMQRAQVRVNRAGTSPQLLSSPSSSASSSLSSLGTGPMPARRAGLLGPSGACSPCPGLRLYWAVGRDSAPCSRPPPGCGGEGGAGPGSGAGCPEVPPTLTLARIRCFVCVWRGADVSGSSATPTRQPGPQGTRELLAVAATSPGTRQASRVLSPGPGL